MTLLRTLFLVVALLLCGEVVAQTPDLAARVDAETLAVVQPILAAAARDSLPVRALESKVLEGIAKDVPGSQIGRVVAELADELRRARVGLRRQLPTTPLTDGEIVAAAAAGRNGVTADLVAELWDARPSGTSVEVPVTVLAELVRRGVSAEEATLLMTHVVRTSVPLHLALQIPGKLDVGLATGAAPDVALIDALRVLNIPRPPGGRPNR